MSDSRGRERASSKNKKKVERVAFSKDISFVERKDLLLSNLNDFDKKKKIHLKDGLKNAEDLLAFDAYFEAYAQAQSDQTDEMQVALTALKKNSDGDFLKSVEAYEKFLQKKNRIVQALSFDVTPYEELQKISQDAEFETSKLKNRLIAYQKTSALKKPGLLIKQKQNEETIFPINVKYPPLNPSDLNEKVRAYNQQVIGTKDNVQKNSLQTILASEDKPLNDKDKVAAIRQAQQQLSEQKNALIAGSTKLQQDIDANGYREQITQFDEKLIVALTNPAENQLLAKSTAKVKEITDSLSQVRNLKEKTVFSGAGTSKRFYKLANQHLTDLNNVAERAKRSKAALDKQLNDSKQYFIEEIKDRKDGIKQAIHNKFPRLANIVDCKDAVGQIDDANQQLVEKLEELRKQQYEALYKATLLANGVKINNDGKIINGEVKAGFSEKLKQEVMDTFKVIYKVEDIEQNKKSHTAFTTVFARYKKISKMDDEITKYDNRLREQSGYEAAKNDAAENYRINIDGEITANQVTLAHKIKMTNRFHNLVNSQASSESIIQQVQTDTAKPAYQTIARAHRDSAGIRFLQALVTLGGTAIARILGFWKPKSEQMMNNLTKAAAPQEEHQRRHLS